MRIRTNDDPTLKLLAIEHISRSLRSSHSQWQHLTESYVVGTFVNALPREYDIVADAGGERERILSRGRRILSAEAVRVIRV